MIFQAVKQILIAISFLLLGDVLIAIACGCFISFPISVVVSFILAVLWGGYVFYRTLNGAFDV